MNSDIRIKGRTQKKHYLFILIMMINFMISTPSHAEFGVAVGYGLNSTMRAFRLAFQASTFSCCELGYLWPMSGFLELGLNKIYCKNSFNCTNCNDQLFGGALNHTFRFSQDDFSHLYVPYIDLGVGIAAFDKREICERKLGKPPYFELKAGAGFRFGKDREYDLSYKYIHYSNGHRRQLNEAINLNFLMLNFWFY